ncbi:MAG: hypothetical protein ACTSUS_07895 [Candidatus Freyarchaeota archaeon]
MTIKGTGIAYEVKVRVTNGAKNTFCDAEGKYGACEWGVIYVYTDNPELIFRWLGDTALEVKRLGIGYSLEDRQIKEAIS